MKKKIIGMLLCACILISMSIVANAEWTSTYTAKYKKNDNYSSFTGIPNAKKQNSSYLNNAIEPSNKTSWTTPKLGVVDTDNIGMTTLNSYYTGTIVLLSYATVGNYYNLNIYGSPNQLGTDTMNVRYNLDYS